MYQNALNPKQLNFDKANIESILLTELVSKLLKSKLIKFLQKPNICIIFVTEEVSKLCISKEIKLEQSKNMLFISITFDVFKLVIFNEVNDEHPLKVPIICVKSVESKFMKSISVIFLYL